MSHVGLSVQARSPRSHFSA